MGDLLAVCRVHQLLPDPSAVGVTAIDKRPVDGRVVVRRFGLYADVQADRRDHGGPDQAVYAYAQEDADVWAAELGRDIPPGLFGENLRTRGIDIGRAVIGERWQVGTAVLEVTQPRVPCQTFARRMGEERWVRRFADANRTGAYLRVVQAGELGAGDEIAVGYRPAHGVTVAEAFAAWSRSKAMAGPVGDDSDDVGPAVDARIELGRRLLEAHAKGDVTLAADMLRRAEQAAGRAVLD
ncbi:MOSC domain-containing protein [Antribacter gilvus]|uniref:MOSC domain-containing protein n=1 Tax=Antribacter gilvus TaxID=2304675 RepID=UPI000F7A63BE|nr:MOSC domain-containing protein [Antribacter gilvus]